jgi:acetolactate synthase-1/2/3 large subunit
MVHVGLGTANALLGIFNAAREHVPMIVSAGRTPVLEHGRLGARNNFINWAQEMFDQGGMVRELVKWDYELRDPAQISDVVDRAFAISQSTPEGPVYLVLPREVLAADAIEITNRGLGVQMPAAAGVPRASDLDRCRQWLSEAQRPLIITSGTGRTREGFDALTGFALEFGIPVVQYRPRYLSVPCSSPVHAGYDATALLPDADLVLVVESDVPWLPDGVSPASGARIVHIGRDPLYAGYPMRSFRSDLTLQGSASEILRELMASQPAATPRTAWLKAATQWRQKIPAAGHALTNQYVSRCLTEAIDRNSVLVNEYTFALEELRIDTHDQFFAHSPAGGLGWAMGASLGIRLARPDATVFAAIGDGTYMFGNPTPTHFVSASRGLPFITVIYNNRRWAAVHRATLSMYPQGAAAAQPTPVFATLEPAPDYERIVEASGGLGLRVEHVSELQPAIERAVNAVRKERRQAVINVLTEATYTRTS